MTFKSDGVLMILENNVTLLHLSTSDYKHHRHEIRAKSYEAVTVSYIYQRY